MHSRSILILALAGLASGAAAQTDIFWNAGSGNWNSATNWSPINVPNAVTENAHILGPAFINVAQDVTVNINDLDVGPQLTLTVNPGIGMIVSGDLVNKGFITVNPTTSTAISFIQFNSNATISGTGGELRLSGGDNDAQLITNGTTITNDVGHSISGAGRISATLVNNGVVVAISTGFGNVLELIGGPKTNNSDFKAAQNAELFISNITITQGPNGMIAADGGIVRFNGNVNINGGRILGTGALLRPGNGNLSLTDVSLEQDIDVEAAGGILYAGAAFNCERTITLNDSGSANDAFIQFNSDTTISGGGSIFLAGGGAPGASNDSRVVTNGTTLTIAPGFTIEGSGDVSATLVNNGLIRAFPSNNGDGRLRLFSGPKTNNAQMVADTGGVLEISGVTINQDTAGEILADGGEINLNASQTINGGTIRTINGGTVSRPGNGNTTLNSVNIDADIPLEASSAILYSGATFDCSGTITLNDSASINNAFIQFNSDATATGGGRIFLAGGGNDSQVVTNGTTLTIASDFTVEGSGDVSATLVNSGLIRAFPSTNGDGRLKLFSGTKTNNTQMVADTGGVLEISSVTVNQDPAAEILADGGEINLNASQTINGGTIRTINGGTVSRPGNGNTTLNSVVIDADIPVEASSAILYSGATFDCSNTITLNDSASVNNAFIQFNSDTIATGGGRIFLAGSGNDSQVVTNGTTLTIGPDFTVEGSGDVSATLVNNGLIRAFPSTNGDGRLRLFTSTKANNAQMVADTGGVLEFFGVTVNQDPTAVILADGGIVEFDGNQTINGGTLRTANGGRLIRIGTGNLTLTDIDLEGDLEMQAPSGLLYNSTSFVNNGAVRVNTTGSTSNAFVQFNASTVITGTGRFALEGGGDDSQITTNGTIVTFGPGQTLEGEGIVNGTYNMNGTLAPGLPVGDITGQGTMTFGSSALLDIEADGNPGANDMLNRTGTINLGGTLRFRFLNGFVPDVFPAVYTVASASTISGDFDALDLPAPIQPGTAVYAGHDGSDVFVAFTCKSDVSLPYGVLDLADVTAFISAFLAQEPLADIAEPTGVFDLADITTFIQIFLSGCN